MNNLNLKIIVKFNFYIVFKLTIDYFPIIDKQD